MGDDAFQALADDGILGGVDNEGEPVLEFSQFAGFAAVEFLVGLAQLLLDAFLIADVADGAQHDHAAFGGNRAEADLHRELGAVFAPAVKVEPRSHAADFRLPMEMLAMSMMVRAVTLGNQHLDPLAD